MKHQLRSKLVLNRELIRQLTAPEALRIRGGLKITDASDATVCIPTPQTPPGTCQDNTAHFCGQI